MSPAKPILQALVLAERVYQDRETGKGIIAGTFNCVQSKTFPAVFQMVTNAFISMTGIRGEVPVILKYVDLSDNEVLMECRPIMVNSDDPLQTNEITAEVPPIPMPHPGVYAFEVHVDGEMLGFLRILAKDVSGDDESEEDEDAENEEDDQ